MVFTLNGGADSITVKDWLDGTPYTRIENIVFDDGSLWRYDEVEALLAIGGVYSADNNAPALIHGLADQELTEAAPWSFQVPAGAFKDIDGDTLTYSATLANGDALPAWMSFNAATKTFSGTPPLGSFGDSLSLKVTATDTAGATGTAVLALAVLTESGPITYTGTGTVVGGSHDDVLSIYGDGGFISGGAGNDTINSLGQTIETTFEGGTGNDNITGSGGKDSYIFNLGDGHDIISDDVRSYGPYEYYSFNAHPDVEGYQDRIFFGPGIAKEDVTISRVGNDMVFTLNGGADSITVKDWLDGTPYTRIENIVFDDGSLWRYDEVEEIVADTPFSGAGVLQGTGYDDTIYATGGLSHLIGLGGNDTLSAENFAGVTNLYFEGGTGDDFITGSFGNDSYAFNRGDGHDSIVDDERRLEGSNYAETAPVHTDAILFGNDVAYDQIWFRQNGNDLDVSVIGTTDHITVKDWYVSAFNQVEKFYSGDSMVLDSSDINNLVQAMASFSPPSAGETTLSPSYSASLESTIAANWHVMPG